MADAVSTADLDNLEMRLDTARNVVQLLTDMREEKLAQSDDGEADQILFVTYQANVAAREADEEFHRVVDRAEPAPCAS